MFIYFVEILEPENLSVLGFLFYCYLFLMFLRDTLFKTPALSVFQEALVTGMESESISEEFFLLFYG